MNHDPMRGPGLLPTQGNKKKGYLSNDLEADSDVPNYIRSGGSINKRSGPRGTGSARYPEYRLLLQVSHQGNTSLDQGQLKKTMQFIGKSR